MHKFLRDTAIEETIMQCEKDSFLKAGISYTEKSSVHCPGGPWAASEQR